ncbi:hypothetical protein SUGI_0484980 [Cryptomeria japonica]|nr:hypothetical protein SUGI_0484980 [Cryptomeria japonica]
MDSGRRNSCKLRFRRSNNGRTGKNGSPQPVKLNSNNTNLPISHKEFMQESNKHYSKDEEEHPLSFLEDDNVPAVQETLVKISGANVHLLDLKGSVSLARGDLSIVRLSQLNTGLAVFAKVGNDLSWPITKDGPIIKLNTLNYLFFVLVPSGVEGNESPQFEILNYGYEIEEELKLLQKCLGYHGCLSGPKFDGYGFRCLFFKPKSMNDVEEYWTRLGPCVKRYNFILGSAVAAGSGEIIQGMFICSRRFLFRVQREAKAIRKKSKAKGFIIKRTNVKGKHMEIGKKESRINWFFKRKH